MSCFPSGGVILGSGRMIVSWGSKSDIGWWFPFDLPLKGGGL